MTVGVRIASYNLRKTDYASYAFEIRNSADEVIYEECRMVKCRFRVLVGAMAFVRALNYIEDKTLVVDDVVDVVLNDKVTAGIVRGKTEFILTPERVTARTKCLGAMSRLGGMGARVSVMSDKRLGMPGSELYDKCIKILEGRKKDVSK